MIQVQEAAFCAAALSRSSLGLFSPISRARKRRSPHRSGAIHPDFQVAPRGCRRGACVVSGMVGYRYGAGFARGWWRFLWLTIRAFGRDPSSLSAPPCFKSPPWHAPKSRGGFGFEVEGRGPAVHPEMRQRPMGRLTDTLRAKTGAARLDDEARLLQLTVVAAHRVA